MVLGVRFYSFQPPNFGKGTNFDTFSFSWQRFQTSFSIRRLVQEKLVPRLEWMDWNEWLIWNWWHRSNSSSRTKLNHLSFPFWFQGSFRVYWYFLLHFLILCEWTNYSQEHCKRREKMKSLIFELNQRHHHFLAIKSKEVSLLILPFEPVFDCIEAPVMTIFFSLLLSCLGGGYPQTRWWRWSQWEVTISMSLVSSSSSCYSFHLPSVSRAVRVVMKVDDTFLLLFLEPENILRTQSHIKAIIIITTHLKKTLKKRKQNKWIMNFLLSQVERQNESMKCVWELMIHSLFLSIIQFHIRSWFTCHLEVCVCVV